MRSSTPMLIRLLATLTIVGSANLVALRANGQGDEEVPAILRAKPLKEEASDDRLRKLLKARYDARLAITVAQYADFRAGKTSLEPLVDSARRLQHAGIDLRDDPAEKIDFLKQMLELCDSANKLRIASVVKYPLDPPRLSEFRAELEITIEKLKKLEKAPRPKK